MAHFALGSGPSLPRATESDRGRRRGRRRTGARRPVFPIQSRRSCAPRRRKGRPAGRFRSCHDGRGARSPADDRRARGEEREEEPAAVNQELQRFTLDEREPQRKGHPEGSIDREHAIEGAAADSKRVSDEDIQGLAPKTDANVVVTASDLNRSTNCPAPSAAAANTTSPRIRAPHARETRRRRTPSLSLER